MEKPPLEKLVGWVIWHLRTMLAALQYRFVLFATYLEPR